VSNVKLSILSYSPQTHLSLDSFVSNSPDTPTNDIQILTGCLSAANLKDSSSPTTQIIDLIELHIISATEHKPFPTIYGDVLVLLAKNVPSPHDIVWSGYYAHFVKHIMSEIFWRGTKVTIIVEAHPSMILNWNREFARFFHLCPMDFTTTPHGDAIEERVSHIYRLAEAHVAKYHPKSRIKRMIRARLEKLKFWK
jgi:hypothetical protein